MPAADDPSSTASAQPTPLLGRLAQAYGVLTGSSTASASPAAAQASPPTPATPSTSVTSTAATATATATSSGGITWPAAHAHKVTTAAEAVLLVRPGDHVFIGTACATPRSLVAALEARETAPADVELVHFLTDNVVPHNMQGECTSRYRHRSFFVGNDVRRAVQQGKADYVPVSIARVPQLMSIGRVRVDVAFIQVSPPDEFGYVSLGVSVDLAPAAVAQARLVVAEVNPHMPRSMGNSTLHLRQIHHLVPVNTPVTEYQHPAAEEQVVEQIARYIGGVIEDGSTLQMGLGRVINQAMKHLVGRQDLGVHSDVITDAIIPLLEAGILTGARKSQQANTIVASFAMGSRRLYDLIDRNPLFSFQPIDVVCNVQTVAAQHKMVSVTQAFAVDLTGQVCADQYNGEFYSGLAAQAEFLQGASRSPGGKAIICLAATGLDPVSVGAGQPGSTALASRIRPTLLAGEGVAITRSDVHYVITEFGIAYLFGKSIRERALALIDVADPQFRAALLEQAKAMGYVPAEQKQKNLRAYAMEDEQTVTLKDQRQVLVRPAQAADADHIRDLFHDLSSADVYTRFFRKVKGLSNQDALRLCNLNYETEVAFVAQSGSRENPMVVAQACYFVDPSTNLAETAFMVHPDWQGTGLGGALQQRMQAHAMHRGVRGFVAEIMATNPKMIRLARSAAGQGDAAGGAAESAQGSIQVQNEGSTVRVTHLFPKAG
jgi:acyl-CoA hydrolase/L-amino acid N-acyltransferase YncA